MAPMLAATGSGGAVTLMSGARAYTLYTIYASLNAESIGTGITSGCVGLLTQDMMHLYSRTPVKTKVVVLPA